MRFDANTQHERESPIYSTFCILWCRTFHIHFWTFYNSLKFCLHDLSRKGVWYCILSKVVCDFMVLNRSCTFDDFGALYAYNRRLSVCLKSAMLRRIMPRLNSVLDVRCTVKIKRLLKSTLIIFFPCYFFQLKNLLN